LLNAYVAKGVLLRQSYGCTELGGGCTLPTRETALQRPASCGRALISCELEVRNEKNEVCKPGEVGEICGKGPQAMLGYWNNPTGTKTAFDGDWYRTGDLAMTDEFGDIIVVDRKKNMIISGGVNVYAAEVERTLLSLPQVLEVVALGIPSKAWGEEVVAVIHADESIDLIQLHAEAKSRLGNFKAPKQIRLSKTPLPKTASGKVARSNLIALFESLAP
jgi:fatty-acyl-CoA synthase